MFAGPFSLVVGTRYKIVIGELWPAPALDLENVSTFQMLDVRAGISVVLRDCRLFVVGITS